jgi:hypothetical protein
VQSALLQEKESVSLATLAVIAQPRVLVEASGKVRVPNFLLLKRTYLVRRHVKVNFDRTSRSRIVAFNFIHCLTCKNKLGQLLNATVKVLHSFRLVHLLQ